MKTVACIIARTNSTRLPRKVLKTVAGRTMIEHIVDRLKFCKNIDRIYICTSTTKEDSVLESISDRKDICFYAGSEDSVIDRMLDVQKIENADSVVRVTGDNIFTDSVYTDIMISYHHQYESEYTRTEYLPIGVTAEIYDAKLLDKIHRTMPVNESQYLMLYAFQPDLYKCTVIIPPLEHQKKNYSFTVDNQKDWDRTVEVFQKLKKNLFSYDDILQIEKLDELPNIFFGRSGTIRMPAGLQMYYEAFRCEMNLRMEFSNKIYLHIGDYMRVKNDQGL